MNRILTDKPLEEAVHDYQQNRQVLQIENQKLVTLHDIEELEVSK